MRRGDFTVSDNMFPVALGVMMARTSVEPGFAMNRLVPSRSIQ